MWSWASLCKKDVPLRTRLMVGSSILCFIYFTLMTLITTVLCWADILPSLFGDEYERQRRHRLFIVFIFINVSGNCILCLFTDTSVKRTAKAITEGHDNITKRKSYTSTTKSLNEIRRSKVKNNAVVTVKDNCSKRLAEKIGASKLDFKSLNTEKTQQFVKTKSCKICNIKCPPRSHHCILCQTCILKRDHHCFFLTVCIGYYNQKYFIMYCFYMMLGTFYGLVLIVMQLKRLYNVQFYGPQTFISLYFEVMGRLIHSTFPEKKYVFLMFMLYGCLGATLLTAGIWFWQLQLTFYGQTTHEMTSGKYEHSINSGIQYNIQDVFGKLWWLHLFFPLPLSQTSDGRYRILQKSQ